MFFFENEGITVRKGMIGVGKGGITSTSGEIKYHQETGRFIIEGEATIGKEELSFGNVDFTIQFNQDGTIKEMEGRTKENANVAGAHIEEKDQTFTYTEGALSFASALPILTLTDDITLKTDKPLTLPSGNTLIKGALKTINNNGEVSYAIPTETTTNIDTFILQTYSLLPLYFDKDEHRDLSFVAISTINEQLKAKGSGFTVTHNEIQTTLNGGELGINNEITITGDANIQNGNHFFTFENNKLTKKRGKNNAPITEKVIFFGNLKATMKEESISIGEKITITKEKENVAGEQRTDITKASARLPYGTEHRYASFKVAQQLLEGTDPDKGVTIDGIDYYLIEEQQQTNTKEVYTLHDRKTFGKKAGTAAAKTTEGTTTVYNLPQSTMKKIPVKDYWNNKETHPDNHYTTTDCQLGLINCQTHSNTLYLLK